MPRANGPIQNLAAGFLQLLGLKNTGQNPSTLVDSVTPVIEMSDWYLQSKLQTIGGTQANAWPNVGLNFVSLNSLGVPDGYIRWVESFSVRTAPAAGNTDLAWRAYTGGPPGVGFQPPVVFGDYAAVLGKTNGWGAGQTFRISSQLNRFWARAGSQFGFEVEINAGLAANLDVVYDMVYADLQI